MTDIAFLDRAGTRIAYRKADVPGNSVGLVWVGGYRSDMDGTKACYVADWAARHGKASLRFDYFAHGATGGDFTEATISRWCDDALAVLDRCCTGKQILIGSSMGGWISNLMMRARPERIAGIIWLAPAPDFSDDLMWDQLPPDVQKTIMEKGAWTHTDETGTYPITRAFIEDGRRNFVLDKPVTVDFPVRILHGMKDESVPWPRSQKIVENITGDVRLTYLKNSDHRLSTPSDLTLLGETMAALYAEIGA